jgi:tRNA(Arg) A34 adenosine deaminase TadA
MLTLKLKFQWAQYWYNNKIIARAHNQVERLNDPTAHAEILAITSACSYLGAKYLPMQLYM